jgi:hypothetical protein
MEKSTGWCQLAMLASAKVAFSGKHCHQTSQLC